MAVFAFLSFILLVRMVPQETFGEWILFITASNFLDMLRFGVTRTAIIRFLSGSDPVNDRKLIGSNNFINLISSVLLALIIFVLNIVLGDTVSNSGFSMFFEWYPLLAIITLPFNNAQSILQAQMKFDKMLILRMINVGSFMIFLFVNLLFAFDVHVILMAYLITNLISSLVASFFNWDGIRYTFSFDKQTNKTVLDFGKYTTGTLIGSNLLKSSDTFIIGLSPFLGTLGVALYSIPLKLTEIIEIPLRSFAATAFPEMSRASIAKNYDEVKNIFYRNAGGMTFLMMPVMLFSFIFAEEIVTLLGGEDYLITANIFRMFCFYGLLLPLDRFIGVGLDSINQPKKNFYKVVYMASFNIFGDLLAVFGFSYIIRGFSWLLLIMYGLHPSDSYKIAHAFTIIKTLEIVSFVTILFTLVGIGIGFYYLDKELHLSKKAIFVQGFNYLLKFGDFLKKR
ncbi:MAG: hypothetical protein FD155_2974 [Bacteroidetes bacterium]|nr:MAG: hypothetical protein FD155_2974 [Bacteroidota bacterium]